MPPTLALEQITKRFPNGALALDNINLQLEARERLAIIGPSGAGKSTLLRLVAGLDSPSSGIILLSGQPAQSRPPHRRDLALMTQNPVLLPHRNVADNITFGLRARRVPRAEITNRLARFAKPLGIDTLLDRKPRQLSGGQQQRVALARALVREPRLLLLDEPLAALDPPLRANLRILLLEAASLTETSSILVTHDITDALTFSENLAVIISGKLADYGPATRVFHEPATLESARFIGDPPMSLWNCQISQTPNATLVRWQVDSAPADACASTHYSVIHLDRSPNAPETAGWLAIRPERVRFFPHPHPLPPTPAGQPHSVVPATISAVENRGALRYVHTQIAREPILALAATDAPLTPSTSGYLQFNLADCLVYDAATGQRIARGLRPVHQPYTP